MLSWKKVVSCKWIFIVKYNFDGNITRYKEQLLTRGFIQSYSIDYQETFGPIPKLNTIRILLSLVANLG
ncbi:hypothetical protein KN825_16140 [Weizmannia coagulans]|nr:hypothetical protein [Heyndrickxia coagulans]